VNTSSSGGATATPRDELLALITCGYASPATCQFFAHSLREAELARLRKGAEAGVAAVEAQLLGSVARTAHALLLTACDVRRTALVRSTADTATATTDSTELVCDDGKGGDGLALQLVQRCQQLVCASECALHEAQTARARLTELLSWLAFVSPRYGPAAGAEHPRPPAALLRSVMQFLRDDVGTADTTNSSSTIELLSSAATPDAAAAASSSGSGTFVFKAGSNARRSRGSGSRKPPAASAAAGGAPARTRTAVEGSAVEALLRTRVVHLLRADSSSSSSSSSGAGSSSATTPGGSSSSSSAVAAAGDAGALPAALSAVKAAAHELAQRTPQRLSCSNSSSSSGGSSSSGASVQRGLGAAVLLGTDATGSVPDWPVKAAAPVSTVPTCATRAAATAVAAGTAAAARAAVLAAAAAGAIAIAPAVVPPPPSSLLHIPFSQLKSAVCIRSGSGSSSSCGSSGNTTVIAVAHAATVYMFLLAEPAEGSLQTTRVRAAALALPSAVWQVAFYTGSAAPARERLVLVLAKTTAATSSAQLLQQDASITADSTAADDSTTTATAAADAEIPVGSWPLLTVAYDTLPFLELPAVSMALDATHSAWAAPAQRMLDLVAAATAAGVTPLALSTFASSSSSNSEGAAAVRCGSIAPHYEEPRITLCAPRGTACVMSANHNVCVLDMEGDTEPDDDDDALAGEEGLEIIYDSS
jgi:trimeric autotransporter adhesin